MLFKIIILISSLWMTASVGDSVKQANNQLDKNGKKTGLWVEKNGAAYIHYLNGQKNGTYELFNKKTRYPECQGEYKNDKLAGNWYYYDSHSQLYLQVENITDNDSVNIVDGNVGWIKPPYKGYVKMFLKDGKLKKEGTAYFEDPAIDCYMYGLWKFYDKKGDLVKQELFKKPKQE